MRMLNTFLREMITQSNTAFSLGILHIWRNMKYDILQQYLYLLIVFNGRKTLNNLIALSLWPVEVLLKVKDVLFKLRTKLHKRVFVFSYFHVNVISVLLETLIFDFYHASVIHINSLRVRSRWSGSREKYILF